MTRSPRCTLVAVASALALTSPPLLADAPDKARCLTAYEGGQALRAERKLRAAREELLLCAAPSCPSAMQPECLRWIAEVDAETPTILTKARLPDGSDAADVRVSIDGEELPPSALGSPISLDPGQHRVGFAWPGGEPQTQTIVARTGEKLRIVEVTLGAPAPLAQVTPPPPAPREATASPTVWPGYLLGGLGVAGMLSFSYFGLSGVLRYEKLKQDCSPRCAQGDADDVHRRFFVADVSLGVGAVALVGAAYVLFWRSPETARGASVGVTAVPATHGGMGVVRGSF